MLWGGSMIIKIKPTFYHKSIMLFNGREKQTNKLVEEMIELKEALRDGDREYIVEELSDVELCLPYLQLSYLSGVKLEIKNSGKQEYDFTCDTMIRMIHLYRKSGQNFSIFKGLSGIAQFYCTCLYSIYADYGISIDEVEQVKKVKMIRTSSRLIKGEL